jgi:glycosyltransferase involved in cell wall biosynthesis
LDILKKKKIYYWSPFLSSIATSKAVINSARSLMKYGVDYECYILNFFGEFNIFDDSNSKVKFLNHYNFNFSKYLPYKGKIKSRFSFLLFFIMGYFPLKKILDKNKPDYLIIHLITSLPLFILIFFNLKTKFILRISGYPHMNFFRKLLWKIALKKIYLITCPTYNTLNYLKSLNIVDNSKIKLLYDPVINVRSINKKKKEKIDFKNYFLSVGRLTKQKNFMFLCKAFKKLIAENDSIKLIIAGSGEEDFQIKKFIKQNDLSKNIILLGYIKNIYPYFANAKGFILSSLWEDPGFVLIEASHCRTPVLSSNSWPGPIELIKDDFNGVTYENDNMESFLNKFKHFKNSVDIQNIKLNGLRLSKKFSVFNHYKNLTKLI